MPSPSSAPLRPVDRLFAEYAESHMHPVNKRIHWVCVPVIFMCVIGLIASIPFPWAPEERGVYFNGWAMLVLGVAMSYYGTLSWPLTAGMLLFSALCLWLTGLMRLYLPLPLWASSLILFALAWVGQFVGHHIEGKKPSFLKDLQFLLIGPFWLLHFIYQRLGIPY